MWMIKSIVASTQQQRAICDTNANTRIRTPIYDTFTTLYTEFPNDTSHWSSLLSVDVVLALLSTPPISEASNRPAISKVHHQLQLFVSPQHTTKNHQSNCTYSLAYMMQRRMVSTDISAPLAILSANHTAAHERGGGFRER